MENIQQKLKKEKKRDIYDDFPKPLRKGKYLFVFSMLIISIISFFVFYIYQNAQSFLLAFQRYTGTDENGKRQFIWTFQNFIDAYKNVFVYGDSELRLAFKNTITLFFIGNLYSIPMGCLVSYFLWKQIPGTAFFRTVFYLPAIITSVINVMMFQRIIAPNGLISSIIIKLGGEALPGLLSDDSTAFLMVIVYKLWMSFAGNYIILFAALCRIPEEIVESVKLDGASAFKEYIHICIPLCWPTLYIILLGLVAGVLSADGPILLLTGGQYSTITIGYWNYKQVILSGSYEFPSAVGLCMTLIVAPLSLLSKSLLSKVYKDVDF